MWIKKTGDFVWEVCNTCQLCFFKAGVWCVCFPVFRLLLQFSISVTPSTMSGEIFSRHRNDAGQMPGNLCRVVCRDIWCRKMKKKKIFLYVVKMIFKWV